MKKFLALTLAIAMVLTSMVGAMAEAQPVRYTVEYMEADGFYRVTNPNGGARLSYTTATILEVEDGGYVYAFKDLNKNGELDVYEDWRLSVEERAADLASQLSLEATAGLMLFSRHTGPNDDGSVTDEQYGYLIDDGVRAILYARSKDYSIAVKWSNELNAITEANDPLGIPLNMSSDPRNSNQGSVEDDLANTVNGSGWPTNLAMAATFEPEYAYIMGQVISDEYRAIGIATALSPQIDLATEPRWSRVSGTYGEDVDLASDIAAAIVSGMQSTWNGIGSDAEDLGWGADSIVAMVKHFPGDGAAEAGREAHNNYGKYNVYPGDNLDEHVAVFAATFNLDTKTERAMAVMPSYSIARNKYGYPIGRDVASGYSEYKMVDILRNQLGFTGVCCSDWEIMLNRVWGVEDMTETERAYMAFMNGLDQIGGGNSAEPVLNAYAMGSLLNTTDEVDGSAVMDEVFDTVAARHATNLMLLGLFEDPYLVTEESKAVFTNEEYAAYGYAAQQDSVVMLKNKGNVLGAAGEEKKTVYVPMQYNATKAAQIAEGTETVQAHVLGDWSGVGFEQLSFDGVIEYSFELETLAEYFNVVTDSLRPETDLNDIKEEDIVRRTDFTGVDFALISVAAPKIGVGYVANKVDLDPTDGAIDNGYYPISLQYGDYTADPAVVREVPLGVDPLEELDWQAAGGEIGGSRYYGGKTTEGTAIAELELIKETRANVGELPVVLYISAGNPFCLYEFESDVDAIVLGLGVSSQAVLDNISGKHEPTGLLPIQLPANMETVETQFEDVGRDMECHVDTEGNAYDFAFGLNWSGVINDERVAKYY